MNNMNKLNTAVSVAIVALSLTAGVSAGYGGGGYGGGSSEGGNEQDQSQRQTNLQGQDQDQAQGQAQGQGQGQSSHNYNKNTSQGGAGGKGVGVGFGIGYSEGSKSKSKSSVGNTSASAGGGSATGGSVGDTSSYSEGSDSSVGNTSADNSITINEAEIPTHTYVTHAGTTRIKNTPDVGAPPLTTSNGTCMGSTSVGGSGPGIGLSVGTTWTDDGCARRYDAEIMNNLGYTSVAINIMCQSDSVAKAAPELCKVKEDDVSISSEWSNSTNGEYADVSENWYPQ